MTFRLLRAVRLIALLCCTLVSNSKNQPHESVYGTQFVDQDPTGDHTYEIRSISASGVEGDGVTVSASSK